jgi:hypothetical protein
MPLSLVVLFSALSTAIAPGAAYPSLRAAQLPQELTEPASRLFSSTWLNPNQAKRTPSPQSVFGAPTLYRGSIQPKIVLLNPPSAAACSIPLLRAQLHYDVDPKMVLKKFPARDVDPGIALEAPAVCPEHSK